MTDASDVADSTDNDVLVICGPTAAGKSAVAMWLAEQMPVTLVSADSRQVYRGFDIGTAKPTFEEQRRVPHLGIDVAHPTTRYSAAMWAESAVEWIDAVHAARRVPIVVGGTGLYLRALFEGLFEEPPLDPVMRDSLSQHLDAFPLSELQRWARVLDPARAHLGRTQLLRAIEIAILTGRRLSDLHQVRPARARWGAGRGLRPRYLLVDAGLALEGRIGRRIDLMFEQGWAEEVRTLMSVLPADAPAWNSTGYDVVRQMIRGEMSQSQASTAILIATRQYAKRQRTWFRHQLPADAVTTLDSTHDDWRDVVGTWAQLGREGRRSV